jgi:hypothetical protein
MTVVIQPNVVTDDERMGVQVGELVRVTHTGIESLHHSPMRFIQCGYYASNDCATPGR